MHPFPASFAYTLYIEVVAPHRDTVADEWQISLDYVRGSNIYVRGYLGLRAWPLRLRT